MDQWLTRASEMHPRQESPPRERNVEGTSDKCCHGALDEQLHQQHLSG
jgi:hypothetical protein